jgi:hypothetical protein
VEHEAHDRLVGHRGGGSLAGRQPLGAAQLDLLNALGLTLGGADITILSLEADQPALAR